MTLDHAHDALLVLTALSLLLAIAGVLLRRTPREPECPRCLYRHAMAETDRCPECGFEPGSAAAWMSGRRRLPRRLRRWNLALLSALAPTLAAIGVLHGRWASFMPTGVLVESFKVMQHGSWRGQYRARDEIDRRTLTPRQADEFTKLALIHYGTWSENEDNDWREQFIWAALSLIVDEGRVRAARNGTEYRRYRPFLRSTGVTGDPSVQSAILDGVASDSADRAYLAVDVLVAMDSNAAPLVPGLLQRIDSPHLSPPVAPMLWRVAFADPAAIRSFIPDATDFQLEVLVQLVPEAIYGRREPALLESANVLATSPRVAGLKSDEVQSVLEAFELQFPHGFEHWRARFASTSPAAASPTSAPP